MIRKSKIKDIQEIHKLLRDFSSKELLLPRPLSELYDHLRDFVVYEDEKKGVVACGALQFCWEDLAEIRSLAVDKKFMKKKIASNIVVSLIKEAKKYGINNLFTLTYVPDFFLRFGFKIISREKLPLKIWADCINCIKFPNCDETAMMLDLKLI